MGASALDVVQRFSIEWSGSMQRQVDGRLAVGGTRRLNLNEEVRARVAHGGGRKHSLRGSEAARPGLVVPRSAVRIARLWRRRARAVGIGHNLGLVDARVMVRCGSSPGESMRVVSIGRFPPLRHYTKPLLRCQTSNRLGRRAWDRDKGGLGDCLAPAPPSSDTREEGRGDG